MCVAIILIISLLSQLLQYFRMLNVITAFIFFIIIFFYNSIIRNIVNKIYLKSLSVLLEYLSFSYVFIIYSLHVCFGYNKIYLYVTLLCTMCTINFISPFYFLL